MPPLQHCLTQATLRHKLAGTQCALHALPHTPICIIAYACMHVLAHNQCCSAEPRVHCMVVYQTGPPRLYRPGEPNLTLSNSCASTTLRNCRNFLLLLLKSFLQLRCSACAASLAANTARAASSHFCSELCLGSRAIKAACHVSPTERQLHANVTMSLVHVLLQGLRVGALRIITTAAGTVVDFPASSTSSCCWLSAARLCCLWPLLLGMMALSEEQQRGQAQQAAYSHT